MLAILAAYGTIWITRRLPARWSWPVAAALAAAVVLVDSYAGPMRVVERPTHPFYATLPRPDGALLPLPLYINVNRSENLTTQMVHGWPIVGGYVARPPSYPFGRYTPGLRELQDGVAQANDIVTPGWPESGRSALAAYAIRYVTLDLTARKDSYFDQVRDRLRELDFGAPIVADGTLEAYAVPRDWQPRPLMFLGGGWDSVERQPDTSFRWRWMGDTAEVRLYNPYDQPVVATLAITASSYQEARTLRLELDRAPFGEFAAQPDQLSSRQFQFLLQPGEHTLALSAPATPDPGRVGRNISVRVYQLAARFGTPTKGPGNAGYVKRDR
jgi:hypothetical protein